MSLLSATRQIPLAVPAPFLRIALPASPHAVTCDRGQRVGEILDEVDEHASLAKSISMDAAQLTRSEHRAIIDLFSMRYIAAPTFDLATLHDLPANWSPRMNTFSELLAQDVMSSPVLSTSPESTVDHLEQEFVRHGVSVMPVVQEGQIVGVISRSDLMRLPVLSAAIESGLIAAGISGQPKPAFRVCELMTRDVVQCSPETELALVAADMIRRHVHHVVVVRNNEPVGVISSLDIVKLTV